MGKRILCAASKAYFRRRVPPVSPVGQIKLLPLFITRLNIRVREYEMKFLSALDLIADRAM